MSDALTVPAKPDARASTSFWRKGRRWHDFTLATLISVMALIGLSAFRVGQVNGMRRAMAQQEPRLVRLESELQSYKSEVAARLEPVAAVAPPTGMTVEQYQGLLRDLRAELRNDIDAVPIGVARVAAASFVPILAFDQDGNKLIEGTAASLGKGYFLTRQADGLVSCLTDGHKGSSGGGIIDARGVHVGIPIGRMNEDHRYSFIQPLSKRMFRKVPHLR